MKRISRGTALTVTELRTMNKRIRDDLEPYIAQKGSQALSPDTVLELAAFFNKLLSHTKATALPASQFLDHTPTKEPAFSLSLNDLQISRIHLALLKIIGPGTRWPSGLIEICETICQAWTELFGDLSKIRPLLYERGGRLYEVRAEKEMSRHTLLVKWLSDRNSLVSPLRALEHGNLEFRPGQWWIHAIFAFYDGIIDSPDPQGGITADSDGAYAITLTDRDEVESSSSLDHFTYRVRKEDKGKYRLFQAILPPKRSIRVLRSHTLQSSTLNPRSIPVVGLRYDGLYKVVSISYSLDQDKSMRAEVRMERDSDQVSTKEVQTHPNSEEIDDYSEYKRLRFIRRNNMQDPEKRAPKVEQVLGVRPTLQEVLSDLDQEIETSPMLRRGAATFRNLTSHNSELNKLGNDNSKATGEFENDAAVAMLDGGQAIPACSNPSAHEIDGPPKSRAASKLTHRHKHSIPMGPIRICCDDYLKNDRSLEAVVVRSKGNQEIDPKLGVDHTTLQELKHNVRALTEGTRLRTNMSEEFFEDMMAMLSFIKRWETQCISNYGFVDYCLWEIADIIYEMIREVV